MPTVTYDFTVVQTSTQINTNNVGNDEGSPSITRFTGSDIITSFDEGFGIYLSIRDEDGSEIFQSAGGVRFNTTDGGAQYDSDIAALTNDRAIVVYNDFSAGAGNAVIRGRLASFSGAGVGNDFQISAASPTLTGDQTNPEVIGLTGGGFVVTWLDFDAANDRDVQAAIFDNSGAVVAANIDVRITSADAFDPQVAALNDGGFVVVWSETPSGGGTDTEIWYSRYNAAGVLQGSATLVDTTGGTNDQPAVIGLADGGWAIAYRDSGWSILDNDVDITYVAFNSAGVQQPYIRLNLGNTANGQAEPSLALLSDGLVAVSYLVNAAAAPASRITDIAVVDPATNARVFGFLATEGSGGWAAGDQMAMVGSPNGRVHTVWRDPVSPGSGGAGTDVYTASFDLSRTTIGDGTNETLTGGDLRDFMYGQDGDDTINAGVNDDQLYGGLGNDTLDGGAGADYLYGEDGNDTLNGVGGNDSIYGGNGNDTIDTGTGTNYVEASYGLDSVTGGSSVDVVYGGADNDTINGNGGNDTLSGDHGVDILNGGDGTDLLYVDSSDVLVSGGNGSDYLSVADVVGASIASADIENWFGYTGNDTFNGGASAQLLYMRGGDGNDTLTGGSNGDYLYGDANNDTINGGDGNDTLTGGLGADTLNGGNGTDVLYVDAADNSQFSGGAGTDYLIVQDAGNGGYDIGTTGIEYAYGFSGIDIITAVGLATNAELHGGDNGDTLYGGSATNVLLGENGNDTLVPGGAGTDHFVGGAGADHIYAISGGGNDYFYDYQDGSDKLNLDLTGLTSFAQVTIINTYAASNWYGVNYGSGVLWVNNGGVGMLDASDFIF